MRRSALILIGFQNDYYSTEGILHGFLENSGAVRASLDRTVELMHRISGLDVPFIETPIVFTPNYEELAEPIGILAAIRDTKAFQAGMVGSQQVAEFAPLAHRITSVPGKRGLNAFVGTNLEDVLNSQGVTHLYLCGSVASICIDSTGRYAAERGFQISVIADCVTGRTRVEHDFYMENVFPLYAEVLSADQAEEQMLQSELVGVGEPSVVNGQRT
jgi:nicotinamidase-related amidase